VKAVLFGATGRVGQGVLPGYRQIEICGLEGDRADGLNPNWLVQTMSKGVASSHRTMRVRNDLNQPRMGF
jgi:hypothetical protein